MSEATLDRRGTTGAQEFYVELGARLRRARASTPQQTLGAAVGLSRGSIANIEAGRQPVSAHTLTLMADVLAVPETQLLPPIAEHLVDPDTTGLDATERRFVAAVRSRSRSEEQSAQS